MSSQHSSSDLPSFVPDRGVLNWVSVVAGYDHNSQPKLCARLVLMHDASIYAVHYCFCGFGEVVPFNILTPVNSEHGDYYQRSGRTESVIIIPHYKTPDAKVNMTSPVYSASNQEQNVYIQLDPFDTFNDYFISRKFLSQNAPSLDSINESDHARVVKVLGNICNEENVPYSQRFVLRFPDGKVLELPTNVSAIAGLGTRVASTNYGEVRVGEILFRTGNPDKLIFSRRREIPEYFAIKVVNLIFIRQLESIRFKFPESPEQELRAMSYVNTLRSMNPDALEFSHLIKLFSALNDDCCLYIITQYCSGGSLQAIVAAKYPQGIPENLARIWFKQIVAGLAVLHALHICHLDISLHNVLVDRLEEETERVLICDFGMSLRVAVDPSTHSPHLIPFRGLCGKGLYLPPEYIRLQDYLKNSKSALNSSDHNDSNQNEYDNNKYNPNCVYNHCEKHNQNLNLSLNNVSSSRSQNLVRPPGTGTALGGEIDGFAADVWMLGVTLLFMITGIKIQDLTLINLFLNKNNSAAQPHKWLGSIPVIITMQVDVLDNDDIRDGTEHGVMADKNGNVKISNNGDIRNFDESSNSKCEATDDSNQNLMNKNNMLNAKDGNGSDDGKSCEESDQNKMDDTNEDNNFDNDDDDKENMSESSQGSFLCNDQDGTRTIEICDTATTCPLNAAALADKGNGNEGICSSQLSSPASFVPSSSSSSNQYDIRTQTHQQQSQQQQQQEQQQPQPQQYKQKFIRQQLPLRLALPSAFDLISKMLQIDPTQRITLSEVRNHPWLTQDP